MPTKKIIETIDNIGNDEESKKVFGFIHEQKKINELKEYYNTIIKTSKNAKNKERKKNIINKLIFTNIILYSILIIELSYIIRG